MIWVFKANNTRTSEVETSDELYDYIYMATPTNFWVLQITWGGIPRDEELVKQILLSVKEAKRSEQAFQKELQLAREQRAVVYVVNAVRMSQEDESVRLLYHLLCMKGTPEEKSYFAWKIKQWSEYRQEFRRLVPKTEVSKKK